MAPYERLSRYRSQVRRWIHHQRMPREIREHVNQDKKGLPEIDPGYDLVVKEGIDWIRRAQDFSKSADGGVARHYSLLDGWSSSYPETTGYIISTLLSYAQKNSDADVVQRARRMLDWLELIQHPEGGFRGGTIGNPSSEPVTFNTGQILLGLCSSVQTFGDRYKKSMQKAADWLVKTQDPDGCWRQNATPFAGAGEKAYETHVAWSLLEAERIQSGRGYAEKGLKNIEWAIKNVKENGWVDKCCLTDPSQPLTHTLGYFLRGLIEAYRFKQNDEILNKALTTAKGLISALKENGYLPGRLDRKWKGTVDWSCLTGAVQIAYCWIELFRITGERKFWDSALAANSFVRRTIKVNVTEPGVRGGIKGSFPMDGEYGAYQFLNWACKFTIDSNMFEKEQNEILNSKHFAAKQNLSAIENEKV